MSFFSLLSKYKVLVYTAFGSENYFKAISKLQSHGVRYRTETFNNNYNSSQFQSRVDNSQYDIYVKPEDEHRAQQAIHGK